LRASILAVAARHLTHHTADPSEHRLAEYCHQASALNSFQVALSQPLDQSRADALLLTSMLLNMLAWSLVEDDDPTKSWVFSSDDDRLGWLVLIMGFKPLLMATASYREPSVLMPIFLASDDEGRSFSRQLFGIDLVPEHRKRLATVGSASQGGSQCRNYSGQLLVPITLLSALHRMAARKEDLFKFLQFVGSLEPDFRQLLFERDERALWVFGFWLGLMRQFDHWWCIRRTVRDSEAIRMFLLRRGVRGRPGEDGVMWRALMDDLDEVLGRRAQTAAEIADCIERCL
jgi:hypothetical protein